ncbi:hypothetical protein ATE48_05015 [Candidatus Viadribacter manganicus]|uniref:Uncharacterized protein n=1 Tax=Candidatus Viadribacter manganicus TaxID=1759059 RepID=A0A1B1AFG2_9PROT|nr:hypothetical protein ATE48_05015 [Candidatus Viadribacter manganicus]
MFQNEAVWGVACFTAPLEKGKLLHFESRPLHPQFKLIAHATRCVERFFQAMSVSEHDGIGPAPSIGETSQQTHLG